MVGSGIRAWDRGSQAMGLGSAVFLGIMDQAVPFLWDQAPKSVTLLESRIRNLGSKMGSMLKKKPCYHTEIQRKPINTTPTGHIKLTIYF